MPAPFTITVDFETAAIEDWPNYPPDPVGVAIKVGDDPAHYYAWGHPDGNNCTREEAVAALRDAWRFPLLFHNGKFDLHVAMAKLGLPMPAARSVHDTMWLGFLCDPHSRTLGLKEMAAELLGWPPDEQDELADWVWAHRKRLVEEYGGRITRAKKGAGSAGAWISKTPGGLCGKYAIGDVDRTRALFKHLYTLVAGNGMLAAYRREQRLLPLLLENERDGIRIDVPALARDVEQYSGVVEEVDDALRERLGAPDLSLDNDRQLADALSSAGIVDDDAWSLTATGQRSVAKDALTPDMFNDPGVASALGYRNRLQTCLKMFMLPWLKQAQVRGGVVSTNWNQTSGLEGGTRTGRPSTSRPNFLNISKDFEGKDDGYVHPAFLGVPKLPLVRRYILPDEGHVFLHRDFDGQELRVFAHFEQGELYSAYLRDAGVDPHALVGAKMAEMMGKEFGRGKVKILNFQSLYGGGAPAAAKQLKCALHEAKEFKAFHDRALPGRKTLSEEILKTVRSDEPIRTWGGRLYYPEPPVNGRSKEYKLINYLVQGSAADLTKDALISWYEDSQRTARFLVTVYDEVNISAPYGDAAREMKLLREHMEAQRLEVPMLSSPGWGPSWGGVQKPPKAEWEAADPAERRALEERLLGAWLEERESAPWE